MGEKKDKKKAVEKSKNEVDIGELDQFIDERIVLNVGGIKYETYRSTLTAHPKTLLGTMFNPRNQTMLHPVNGNEYFIDRNGYAFHYIMEYYRTGSVVWRPSPELPFENPSSNSDSPTTTVPSDTSTSIPTGALAALSLSGPSSANNGSNNVSTNSTPSQPYNHHHVLHRHHHHTNQSSDPPIFPPYISLPELEEEFTYFIIPFTSPLPIAQRAGGALLDEFAYSVEDLICSAIARLIDRVSITFFRDGSPMECILIQPNSGCCNNRYRNNNNNNTNNNNGCSGGSKLIEFSLNGYCIVNHFYEDIRKYLENVFPKMIFRLEFGNNYKSITMEMSGLFTRHAIQKYSKIGKLSNIPDDD